MIKLACLIVLAGAACAIDDPASDPDDSALSASTCQKRVTVWFEPTSGMDAITNNNGCWVAADLTSGADGYGWCAEVNGTMIVKHAPADTRSWFFDDTNPVRTPALDGAQIHACYDAMPKPVPGIEVMARRYDSRSGTTHWQKLYESNAGGWIVDHWIAELHASAYDVASYLGAWEADPSIGIPQVNAPDVDATCDGRVYDAVLAVCKAIKAGGTMSVVKNDGRLAYLGGCLTHVTEALNACTR
ncbi:MAG TPA: hypothetical protein VLX92_16875 [Kofleriaceae bacterium]|nr:hypothetical protein [Kofleriaceae bacterium]